MKKIYMGFTFIIFLLLLTGCSDNFLEQEKVMIIEQNRKTEKIVSAYKENEKAINVFNSYFLSSLNDFSNYSEDIEIYTPNRSMKESILEMRNQITNYLEKIDNNYELNTFLYDLRENENIFFYSFLEEDTGRVIEYIRILTPMKSFVIILNWDSGFIIEYDYYFLEG